MIEDKYNIKTQEDAIRHFIERMDTEMLMGFLNSKKTYQDMSFQDFIIKLEQLFKKFIAEGDEYLISFRGKCIGCFAYKKGYLFVGNNTLNYISLIIDAEKGIISDIFECSKFKTKNSLLLNKKLFLDEKTFPNPF
jgi:hypothetical protein